MKPWLPPSPSLPRTTNFEISTHGALSVLQIEMRIPSATNGLCTMAAQHCSGIAARYLTHCITRLQTPSSSRAKLPFSLAGYETKKSASGKLRRGDSRKRTRSVNDALPAGQALPATARTKIKLTTMNQMPSLQVRSGRGKKPRVRQRRPRRRWRPGKWGTPILLVLRRSRNERYIADNHSSAGFMNPLGTRLSLRTKLPADVQPR